MDNPTGPFRLILWPTVITAFVSIARLVGELTGLVPPTSGGMLHPLGITWCVFVFGAWMGWRLSRSGSSPRMPDARGFTAVMMLVLVGASAWQFGTVGDKPDFNKLREVVLVLSAVASTLAIFALFAWPRLALAMLFYAIPARALVLAFTWLAKTQEWKTHYTLFGPTGLETELGDTLNAAALAQFGFWVPFTVVGGTFAGAMLSRRAK